MIQRDVNTTPTLSYDELAFVVTTVVESTDTEITRIVNEKELRIVLDALYNLYHNTNYFSLFTLQSLKELTVDIFDSEPFRDFILNVVERVSVELPYSEIDENRLVQTIVRAVCRNKSHTDNSLIIREIKESIFINPEVLQTCLKDNF